MEQVRAILLDALETKLISLNIFPYRLEVKCDYLRDRFMQPLKEQYYYRVQIIINDRVIERVMYNEELDKWLDAEIDYIIKAYMGYDKLELQLPKVKDYIIPKDVKRLKELLKETPKWKILKRRKIIKEIEEVN